MGCDRGLGIKISVDYLIQHHIEQTHCLWSTIYKKKITNYPHEQAHCLRSMTWTDPLRWSMIYKTKLQVTQIINTVVEAKKNYMIKCWTYILNLVSVLGESVEGVWVEVVAVAGRRPDMGRGENIVKGCIGGGIKIFQWECVTGRNIWWLQYPARRRRHREEIRWQRRIKGKLRGMKPKGWHNLLQKIIRIFLISGRCSNIWITWHTYIDWVINICVLCRHWFFFLLWKKIFRTEFLVALIRQRGRGFENYLGMGWSAFNDCSLHPGTMWFMEVGGGGACEALHQFREVLGLRVYHLGRACVYDHRWPALSNWNFVRTVADLQRRRPSPLKPCFHYLFIAVHLICLLLLHTRITESNVDSSLRAPN